MQKFKRKLTALITAFAMAVVCTVTGALGALAGEDYHTWRQMDPRWGGVSMNGTTISRSGCLITSLSVMIMHSNSLNAQAMSNLGISSPDQFNPGVLANAYSARGGFTYGGGIASWGTISQIVPTVTFVRDSNLKSYTQSEIAAELKAMLDSGLHVIVNANGHHWVYIEGVAGDDVYMVDPANDEPLLFNVYGYVGGAEYWALKCAEPPHFDAPDITPPEPDEYLCTAEGSAPVLDKNSDGANVIAQAENSAVLSIMKTENGFGLIVDKQADGAWSEVGWIRLSDIAKPAVSAEHADGDINNDGKVDMYDISILSEYLYTKDETPSWSQSLLKCEAEAADLNGDGIVDEDDLMILLERLCY